MESKKKLQVRRERLKDLTGSKLRRIRGAAAGPLVPVDSEVPEGDTEKNSYCRVSD